MLYELHVRGYTERTQCEKESCEDAFCLCPCNPSLNHLEESLWKTRVKLAANISRARIRKGAVHLSDLLPKHLRDTTKHRSKFTTIYSLGHHFLGSSRAPLFIKGLNHWFK